MSGLKDYPVAYSDHLATLEAFTTEGGWTVEHDRLHEDAVITGPSGRGFVVPVVDLVRMLRQCDSLRNEVSRQLNEPIMIEKNPPF